MSRSDGRLFRLASRATGEPFDNRVWTRKASASLALRNAWVTGLEVQEGQATWPTVNPNEEELRNGTEELVLPLEHPDLGEQPAP